MCMATPPSVRQRSRPPCAATALIASARPRASTSGSARNDGRALQPAVSTQIKVQTVRTTVAADAITVATRVATTVHGSDTARDNCAKDRVAQIVPYNARVVATDLKLLRLELMAGTRVGAYEVEDVRARLPHVTIHRARHVVTGRPVALQVLRPLTDAQLVRVIRRELAALNRLRHAHVAEILETGELADGRSFLVVEWVAGRSLKTLIDGRERLSLDEALPIADEIGAALAAAHALGVVHGDLVARNVGLVARGEHLAVKLVNFGMARLSGGSVEQSRAGDIFAFAALLYQMVTGIQPSADPPPPSVYAA